MERMLINATQQEEIRVAMVKDNYLYDLDIERPADIKKKANIYKGRVTRIEPSLEAAFVDFGSKRQGFLPLKEIAPEYFISKPKDENKLSIKDLLREGQELMVQVDKEERGNKGAALTTYITLAGCYLVLMPNNPRSGGISRRIEGDEREELKETLNQLNLPEGMGLIVRTAGLGKGSEELQWDLEVLINQWNAIKNACKQQLAPFLIHQEGDVILRSIRDNLRKSIKEIIIDGQEAYIKAKHYIEQVKPDFIPFLMLYNDTVPLFTRYQIESQIETAYQREVILPSGGSLVIDRTEALVSIDINSAKATSGSDIENTALNTNLEAANEIARQLRIRDLGGLIVIDFIDMSSTKNQREVESRLRESLKTDRARIQVGRISRFGLLEMSRQRLRLSLGEGTQEICPRCNGRGSVRSIQSHSLSIIRLLEEEALKENTSEIQVQLPVEMATFIINEKRDFLLNIEKRHGVSILVLANPYFQAPKYSIIRITDDSGRAISNKKPSYALISEPDLNVVKADRSPNNVAEPAIKTLTPPQHPKEQQVGFVKRLWTSLFGAATSTTTTTPQVETTESKPRTHQSSKQSKHRSSNRQQRGGNTRHRNQPVKRRGNQTSSRGHASSKKGQTKVVPMKTDGKKKERNNK
jgi:ribonuclease E